ncbi:MAG: tyrosine-type recombinase/integrase [Actinomycetota bacterium]|nr:tyrosine-type recombinase/integrase [Actinomycetota bacterium]
MRPATANAPRVSRPAGDLLAAYEAHLGRSGRGNSAYTTAARSFMKRWPSPQGWAAQPLAARLRAGTQVHPFLMFLMVHGLLRPGWDYLVARKLSSFWREVAGSPIEAGMNRFVEQAEALGYSRRQTSGVASQVIGRALIQTGRPLEALTVADLDDLAEACAARQTATGQGWRHYRGAIHTARHVLFHLEITDSPPAAWLTPKSLDDRVADAPVELRPAFVAYLQRKQGTCRPKTVSSLATRLAHFGRFLAEVDPDLETLAGLDRQVHIEPYLNAVAQAVNASTGAPISVADQARRILAVANFLTEVTEWGWHDVPARRLIFSSDLPRLPRPVPRYLPLDADRRLSDALEASEYRLAADALLLARACGLRIGELLDLELDCVHEIPGNGAWLKVPLGKLDTERMVPLDDETVALVDRIVATRAPGQPLPHPRSGRSCQFLFTHHGRRLSQSAVRAELTRAATTAGIGHATPHQLRHTYATALVNAGVSLQALMALLGHVSAEMSLRYGRLFDTTVRAEYERALDLAKSRLGSLPTGPARIPVRAAGDDNSDWRDQPALKSRLAGGYCLRAPAQGACPYANICEHCPSFRADASSLPVLAAQRVDAEALAADAEKRGWIDEADRHRRLIARLDTLLAQHSA